MATFLNISPGQERTAPGLRVAVSGDGERVWMHGKWLDLGKDHAVAWIVGRATFIKADGSERLVGEFPGWSVRSKDRGGASALMFNAGQFYGGKLIIRRGKSVSVFEIAENQPN